MTTARAVAVLVVALVAAGCLGASGSSPAGTPTDAPAATDRTVGHETYVFDHAGLDEPAIQGGIRYPRDFEAPAQFYATLVATATEADRFDGDVLDAGAREFVEATDFDRSYLVVFQAFPASSAPDYRVESVRRSDGGLHVSVNDSAAAGTADVTVETVLVRVGREGRGAPDQVTITTEEGVSVTTGTGVRTLTPEPTPTPDDVSLPYASADESENVEEPVDLRVVNRGNETNGYRVTVTATETPACREYTPSCGRPSRDVAVLERTGKLRPGESIAIEDVVAKRGTYGLSAEADVPAGDGGRRTVSTSVDWVVGAAGDDVTVTLTDEDVDVEFAHVDA